MRAYCFLYSFKYLLRIVEICVSLQKLVKRDASSFGYKIGSSAFRGTFVSGLLFMVLPV